MMYVIKYRDGSYRSASRWRTKNIAYAQVYTRAKQAIKYAERTNGVVAAVKLEETGD